MEERRFTGIEPLRFIRGGEMGGPRVCRPRCGTPMAGGTGRVVGERHGERGVDAGPLIGQLLVLDRLGVQIMGDDKRAIPLEDHPAPERLMDGGRGDPTIL